MSAIVGKGGMQLDTGESQGVVDRYRADDFEPLIGDVFKANSPTTGQHFELRLAEVTRFPDRKLPVGYRQPFSLIFEPVGRIQPRTCECYRFEHGLFGEVELLATPITIPLPTGPELRLEVAFG